MKGTTHIKAISFDGDMTLWDFEKVMRHSLGYTLAALQERVPCQSSADLTISKMIQIRDEVATALKGSVVNLEEIRLHAFRRTMEFVGSDDYNIAADLNALYLKHRFEDIELYPDVIPALNALSSRFSLGLLSNGNGYPERCGLTDLFSFVTFSQDVGIEKPAPDIFLTACQQAGCNPRELMHVGDSIESDVHGAKGVGALSVWLNRDGRGNETGIVPDFEIQSLSGLIEILNQDGDASNHGLNWMR